MSADVIVLDEHRAEQPDDAHINTHRYVSRWGYAPAGRTELWCVTHYRRLGSAEWYHGPYSHLVRYLGERDRTRNAWTLGPVPQVPTVGVKQL